MVKWKFSNHLDILYEAEYSETLDMFLITKVGAFPHPPFEYLPDEVEDKLSRGIWKRVS